MFANEHFDRATAKAMRPTHSRVCSHRQDFPRPKQNRRKSRRQHARRSRAVHFRRAGFQPRRQHARNRALPIALLHPREVVAFCLHYAPITTHHPHHLGRNGQSTSHTGNLQKTHDRAHARAELPGAFSFSDFLPKFNGAGAAQFRETELQLRHKESRQSHTPCAPAHPREVFVFHQSPLTNYHSRIRTRGPRNALRFGVVARGPRNAPRFGVATRNSQSSRNAPDS